ncbi:MAG TPA: nucleoside deaminase [Polyangiaceae bacterium]|nr:nucleoside deaminase [Polyangiaceae bacterium]
MALALAEARAAAEAGDVPVGAVLTDGDRLIAMGRNRREALVDPTAHAELEALRAAAAALGRWRLDDLTMYVTLEPCPMCAGALVNARLGQLVYAAPNHDAGAIDTLFVLGRDPRLNHRFDVTRGVCEAEAADLLRSFFATRR